MALDSNFGKKELKIGERFQSCVLIDDDQYVIENSVQNCLEYPELYQIQGPTSRVWDHFTDELDYYFPRPAEVQDPNYKVYGFHSGLPNYSGFMNATACNGKNFLVMCYISSTTNTQYNVLYHKNYEDIVWTPIILNSFTAASSYNYIYRYIHTGNDYLTKWVVYLDGYYWLSLNHKYDGSAHIFRINNNFTSIELMYTVGTESQAVTGLSTVFKVNNMYYAGVFCYTDSNYTFHIINITNNTIIKTGAAASNPFGALNYIGNHNGYFFFLTSYYYNSKFYLTLIYTADLGSTTAKMGTENTTDFYNYVVGGEILFNDGGTNVILACSDQNRSAGGCSTATKLIHCTVYYDSSSMIGSWKVSHTMLGDYGYSGDFIIDENHHYGRYVYGETQLINPVILEKKILDDNTTISVETIYTPTHIQDITRTNYSIQAVLPYCNTNMIFVNAAPPNGIQGKIYRFNNRYYINTPAYNYIKAK